jgi:riboflavin kinase / FMN adenylyltransferase
MQVHLGVGSLHPEWPEAVVCLGTFDGVHLGHEAVIRRAVHEARGKDLPCVLVTFDRHPAAILSPSSNPKRLASLEENLARFAQLGVSITLILPFDENLSQMSANDFLAEILRGGLHASEIVVGHDFAMGHGRIGTAAWLAERIRTTIVPAFEVGGERVSSSAIRLAVCTGEVDIATKLLGRPYALTGVIVSGQKLGRTIGFPTANLARTVDQVVPLDGVYACWFEFEKGRFAAATSIGTRPAVNGVGRTIESFLLDYTEDSFYGQSVRLEFIGRIREERNYPSLEALTEAISLDVAQVRARLVAVGPSY